MTLEKNINITSSSGAGALRSSGPQVLASLGPQVSRFSDPQGSSQVPGCLGPRV